MKSLSEMWMDEKQKLFEKEVWKKRCDSSTLGNSERRDEYLANRLDATLDDGIAIGRKIEREMLLRKFAELFSIQTDALK